MAKEPGVAREQAGRGNQPGRPVCATGLPTTHRSGRQAWRKRSLAGWGRPWHLIAAGLLVVLGVGLLVPARAAIDAVFLRAPNVEVVAAVPTNNAAEATTQSAAPAETPGGLIVSALATPTNHVLSTPTPPAMVPAVASTTTTATVVASYQVSVTSTRPQAVTAVPAAMEVASAEPESTEVTEATEPRAEPAIPAPPNQPAPAYRTYVVQRGDILKQIAARYGVSLASIIAINRIPNPDSLQVGQVLTIPPAGS